MYIYIYMYTYIYMYKSNVKCLRHCKVHRLHFLTLNRAETVSLAKADWRVPAIYLPRERWALQPTNSNTSYSKVSDSSEDLSSSRGTQLWAIECFSSSVNDCVLGWHTVVILMMPESARLRNQWSQVMDL